MAASTALGLVFTSADDERLALVLSRLAREELAHFEMVVALLRERGLRLRRVEPPAYAARLREPVRPAGLVDVAVQRERRLVALVSIRIRH